MSQKKKQDERLPTGAIVYWSREFKRGSDQHYYVPVWCPDCEEERNIHAGDTTRAGFTGLCTKHLSLRRSAAARREYPTADERLSTDSVIHWSETFTGAYRHLCVPVTCGVCQRKRPVRARDTREATFTGCCDKHKRRYTGMAPGTKREEKGYVRVKLARNHPFYSMADRRGWIAEHRLVMAETLGRPLRSDEIVHHKNGRKDDNRPENLELWRGGHPRGQRVAAAAVKPP